MTTNSLLTWNWFDLAYLDYRIFRIERKKSIDSFSKFKKDIKNAVGSTVIKPATLDRIFITLFKFYLNTENRFKITEYTSQLEELMSLSDAELRKIVNS